MFCSLLEEVNNITVDSLSPPQTMKQQGRILSTVSLIHAVNDGSIAVISILFPIFKEIFHLSYTQVGIITGGGLFITLIAQLVLGRLADGKNVNSFLLTGMLLTSLSLVLLSFSNGFITLICFIFFMRFATSFFHPIGIGWISRTYKKGRLDWAMGIQSGSADLGAFLAILTTLSISQLTHWTVPLYGWACICILGLLVSVALTYQLNKELVFVTEREKETYVQGNGDRCIPSNESNTTSHPCVHDQWCILGRHHHLLSFTSHRTNNIITSSHWFFSCALGRCREYHLDILREDTVVCSSEKTPSSCVYHHRHS